MRVAVVEGLLLNCNMLHMVLYHQVHENGIEKKKKPTSETKSYVLLSARCARRN